MKAINLWWFVVILFPFSTFAGRVRTLPASSQEMPVIKLMTGRSTVLRFSSPPKKVIVGNQNYFNIEFIDSDVTIQPLASTASNLFVYGDSFTYGFILNVGHSGDYDDLVFIRNKVPAFATPKTEKESIKVPVAKKDLKFTIVVPKKSKIDLQGNAFKWNESINSFYADVFITLKAQKTISTDSAKIQILSAGQDLTTIKAVFEKDQLVQNVKGRARIFANVNSKDVVKLKLLINKEEMIFDLKWKK
ncbi:MAG: hypothetical protein IPK04_14960 [Bdellovibrionales bacterium]|nr:hypothetical protein [Bdellovibrionales bacterium]